MLWENIEKMCEKFLKNAEQLKIFALIKMSFQDWGKNTMIYKSINIEKKVENIEMSEKSL